MSSGGQMEDPEGGGTGSVKIQTFYKIAVEVKDFPSVTFVKTSPSPGSNPLFLQKWFKI
ncbi:MAG: hypothetical protein R3B65_01515 [Candidatus Paceibacterota bacterium]